MVGSLNELSTHAQIRVRPRIFQQHGDDDGESLVEAAQAPMTREWRSLMTVLALVGILLVRSAPSAARTATRSSTSSRIRIVIRFLFSPLYLPFLSAGPLGRRANGSLLRGSHRRIHSAVREDTGKEAFGQGDG